MIKATEVVEQDPECVDALWALLELGLPERRRMVLSSRSDLG